MGTVYYEYYAETMYEKACLIEGFQCDYCERNYHMDKEVFTHYEKCQDLPKEFCSEDCLLDWVDEFED